MEMCHQYQSVEIHPNGQSSSEHVHYSSKYSRLLMTLLENRCVAKDVNVSECTLRNVVDEDTSYIICDEKRTIYVGKNKRISLNQI